MQEGYSPNNSLANSVDFTGAGGLYSDLGSGNVPTLSFIVPNQCNYGTRPRKCRPRLRVRSGRYTGTQAGLNPALTLRADLTVRQIVTAIKSSSTWSTGNNAIVVVWDENDYSLAPYPNKVVLLVDTSYAPTGVVSSVYYTHFALLKTLEAGFGLPCLISCLRLRPNDDVGYVWRQLPTRSWVPSRQRLYPSGLNPLRGLTRPATPSSR